MMKSELRYILDPKEVYGEDFPGETFRVLKEKEVKQFGDAPRRTRRLVLEPRDGIQAGKLKISCVIRFKGLDNEQYHCKEPGSSVHLILS
ncbi:MAG TPA: hypothetical protein VK206_18850 [Anaerolineales bacterium]|nr:hypothetical protein [Anaerolineales bacterium]